MQKPISYRTKKILAFLLVVFFVASVTSITVYASDMPEDTEHPGPNWSYGDHYGWHHPIGSSDWQYGKWHGWYNKNWHRSEY
jgi:hypothetical protein